MYVDRHLKFAIREHSRQIHWTLRGASASHLSIPEPHFEKQTRGLECLLWPSLRQIDDLQSGFVIALFALAALESGALIAAPDVYSTHVQSHTYTLVFGHLFNLLRWYSVARHQNTHH